MSNEQYPGYIGALFGAAPTDTVSNNELVACAGLAHGGIEAIMPLLSKAHEEYQENGNNGQYMAIMAFIALADIFKIDPERLIKNFQAKKDLEDAGGLDVLFGGGENVQEEKGERP